MTHSFGLLLSTNVSVLCYRCGKLDHLEQACPFSATKLHRAPTEQSPFGPSMKPSNGPFLMNKKVTPSSSPVVVGPLDGTTLDLPGQSEP